MKLKQFGYFILLLVAMLTWKVEGLFGQQTEIGGNLIADRTLFADTTYIVVEDLRVASGIRLQIEAGTQLRFKQGKGLLIDGGNLHAVGQTDQGVDSIRFVADYTNPAQAWKWKGILVQNCLQEDGVNLMYIVLKDAEVGLSISSSAYTTIRNSTIADNFWRGILIENSHSVLIAENSILDNYVGIEVIARGQGNQTEWNVINSNIIRSINTNISFSTERGGKFSNNTIFRNIILEGLNGIWLDNSGANLEAVNSIQSNVFYDIGEAVGYALYLAVDSVIVRNNIFWKNNLAIFSRQKGNNQIQNNSFYANKWALLFSNASNADLVSHNSFTLNEKSLLVIQSADQLMFENNNLFYTQDENYIVENSTTVDFSVENNFWGTTDLSKIESLIYDGNENPGVGFMQFLPVLEQPDQLNPVAPPFGVIKQWDGQRVIVSWDQNIEAYVAGYRVHYGGFANYQFSESMVADDLNTLLLPSGVDYTYSIGLTAYKEGADFQESIFNGDESPYSFARLYPYAGPDTTVCNSNFEFETANAQVPFEYQKLFWSSAGDGYFLNETSLHTLYYPGIVDSLEGQVNLYLNVIVEGDTLTDGFQLMLLPSPIVFAGNDSIIYQTDSIELSHAMALHSKSVNWTSLGDGSFLNDTVVITSYYPGSQDRENQSVQLILSAIGYCDAFVSDTVTLSFESAFPVEGKVWSGNTVLDSGVVIAFLKVSSGYAAGAVVPVRSNGEFRFDHLPLGAYIFYGVPDTSLSQKVLPAYYVGESFWSSAHLVEVDAPIFELDLQLPVESPVLIKGVGSISGKVNIEDFYSSDSYVYCRSWFEPSIPFSHCEEGLTNLTVLLYNSTADFALDFTLTDDMGKFVFDSIPFGTYKIAVEKAGHHTLLSPDIVISSTNPRVEEMVFLIHGKHIELVKEGSYPSQSPVELSVFPNPVLHNTEVNLNGIVPGEYLLQLFTTTGVVVYSKKLSIENRETNFKKMIKMDNLAGGVYLLLVRGNDLELATILLKR